MGEAKGSPQVRGTALLGLLKHLKHRDKMQSLQDILGKTSPSTRELFERRIRSLAWYDYSAYAELLRAVAEVVGGSDLSYGRTVGEDTAQADLATVFKPFSVSGPQRLLEASGRLWQTHYRNAGTMKAVREDPEDTALQIVGFDDMDLAHCRVVEGWIPEAMRLVGAEIQSDCREQACTSRGDAVHEFVLSWSGPSPQSG